MTRYLRSEFRTWGRQQVAITAGSKAGASPVHPLRLESCRPRLVDELWRQGCVGSVLRDAPHTNTPWGTFDPLILDPIWMVLAAIAVQITATLDLVARDAEDSKPLYSDLHRLSAQVPQNALSASRSWYQSITFHTTLVPTTHTRDIRCEASDMIEAIPKVLWTNVNSLEDFCIA